jgi:hypothetical protein
MDYKDNVQLKLAQDYVLYTNTNVFLTGKAGTGKTTFLRNLRYSTPKRMIVVAPTGVAAINAGGVTIHSFFQLAFAPFIPGYNSTGTQIEDGKREKSGFSHKINRNKIKIIKSLDLLVIDEISMVRADLLDAIDDVLRRYRNTNKPFGGVQLLMIGDLHQLAPVIKDDEWQMIREYYESAYFFSSNALKKTDFTCIELKHIYRQEDEVFINLLGEIRENRLSENSREILNSRYIPDFNPEQNEGYITLTTHNATASEINEKRLNSLSTARKKFKAKISKDFPPFMFPTDEELILKKDAQVMFIKNDSSFDKLYYNGKIGQIIGFDDGIILVKCDDEEPIAVKPEKWENVKYVLNEETKEIEEDIVGSFEQYPLRLAWAITIHKSQGLTFEKAILDVNAAFAFGQVYVALSRCKTLEGMVMISKISDRGIKSDISINDFNQKAQENEPDSSTLTKSKLKYQKELIFEQFDFDILKKMFFRVRKCFNENIVKFDSALTVLFDETLKTANLEIFEVADKFNKQLQQLITEDNLPQENELLQERIMKAAAYFNEKISKIYLERFENSYFDSDNKDAKKEITDLLQKFELQLLLKTNTLQLSKKGFDTIAYLKSLADTDMDFSPKFNKKTVYVRDDYSDISNKSLYAELNLWRKSIADEAGVPVFMILPQQTLKSLVDKLPQKTRDLSKLKGWVK